MRIQSGEDVTVLMDLASHPTTTTCMSSVSCVDVTVHMDLTSELTPFQSEGPTTGSGPDSDVTVLMDLTSKLAPKPPQSTTGCNDVTDHMGLTSEITPTNNYIMSQAPGIDVTVLMDLTSDTMRTDQALIWDARYLSHTWNNSGEHGGTWNSRQLSRRWPCRPQRGRNGEKPDPALPLHLKDVASVTFDQARTFIKNHCPRLTQHWDTAAAPFYSAPPNQLPPHEEAELTMQDIGLLLKMDLIAVDNTPDIPAWPVRIFTVEEKPENPRRRIIMHPPEFNCSFPLTECTLPTPTLIVDQFRTHELFTCMDIQAYYQNIRLPSNSRFQFVFEGKRYLLKSIPTGAAYCPALAQILSSAVAEAASEFSPHVCTAVYLDNFRFGGDAQEVRDVTERFLKLTAELQLKINESCVEPARDHVFLGIVFEGDTVNVKPSTKQKLDIGLLDGSLRQFLQFFGILSWCSEVLALPKWEYYHIYKFLRRRHGSNLDAAAHTWNCIRPVLLRWKTAIISHSGRNIRVPPLRQRVLFTDASETGWGAVLFDGDDVDVVAAPFSAKQKKLNINQKEALAIREAANIFNCHEHNSILFVDNQSVIGALKKGRSSSYLLNSILAETPFRSATYVTSATNLADTASRLFGSLRNADNATINRNI